MEPTYHPITGLAILMQGITQFPALHNSPKLHNSTKDQTTCIVGYLFLLCTPPVHFLKRMWWFMSQQLKVHLSSNTDDRVFLSTVIVSESRNNDHAMSTSLSFEHLLCIVLKMTKKWQLVYNYYIYDLRGPLDILKEVWETTRKTNDENVISYILSTRERLREMSKLV